MQSVEQLVERLLESLKNIEFQLKPVQLEEQTFIEDYNGYPPRVVIETFGLRDDKWDEELTRIMNDAGEKGKFKLYITVDGIFVKKTRARYNQFGRWVGTDMKVYTLSSVINMLKEKSERAKLKVLIETIKQELERIQT